MPDYDPTGAIILGLLTLVIIGYALYLKLSIRRLDRRIAEREAAEASHSPSPNAR